MATISIELKGIDHASQVVNNVKVSLNQLHSQAQSAGSGITSSLQRIGETAAGFLTAQAIPALANMGRQALSVATDYQSAMNIMQAVSGATAEQMAAVGQRAKELGSDMSLPATSAGDAALAMTELVKAGLSVGEAMESARGVLQLSAAGQLSNSDAAMIAANALNAYRNAANGAALASSDMGKVADILAAGANASSASVHDLALGMQMSASSAASAGVPFQSLVAMIGQMSNAGIQGSDAGTSLKTMLMRLQAPTDQAAALMQRLGIEVFNAQGAMNPIQAIIGQFSSKLGGLTQEQRNAALATIFGSDAIRAANTVLMGGVGAFDAMSTAVGRQGAAADLAKAQMAGLGGAFQGLKSQIETALLELSEPALPFLESIVRQIADAIPKVVDQVKLLGQQIGQAIAAFQAGLAAGSPGAATAGFLAALGLSESLAGQIGAIVAQVNSVVQSSLGVLRATMAGFAAGGAGGGAAAFASAIGLGPEAATAIGAAVQQIANMLQGGLATAVGVARSAFDGLRGVAGAVFTALPGYIAAVLPNLLMIANIVSSVLNVAFAVAGQLASQVFGALPGLVSQGMGIITTLAGIVSGVLAQAFQALAPVVMLALMALPGLVQTGIGMIQALVTLVGAGLVGAFNFLAPIAVAAFQGVATIVQLALPPLISLLGIIGSQLTAAFTALKPLVDSAWATMQSALPVIIPIIQNLASLVGTLLGGAFTALGQVLTGNFGGAWETVKATVTAAGPFLSSAVTTIVEGIKGAWAFLQPHLVTLANAAWDAVKGLFSAAMAALLSGIQNWWAGVAAAFVVSTAGILAGIYAWWTGITNRFNEATGAVLSGIQSWWAGVAAAFVVSTAGILAGIYAWWTGITNRFNEATGAVLSGIQSWWSNLQSNWNAATGLIQSITSTWWSALRSTFELGVSTVRAVVDTAWGTIKTLWNSYTATIDTLTSAFWAIIKAAFSGNFDQIKVIVSQAWDMLKAIWNNAFQAVKANLDTTWQVIKSAWSTQFNGIKNLSNDTWEVIKGVFDRGVAFVKGLMDRLGEAFRGVSSAISGTISALKKLADTARSIGDAIPDWMRPGSPMPLGLAFEHLQGAVGAAAGSMTQFGQAAQNASSAPVIDIRLLLNGQTVASAGAFGSTLAQVIEALVMPLAGLHEAIDSRVAGTLQRISDSLKHVQTLFETVFRIIALIATPPALTDVGPNSPTITFVRNVTQWALQVAAASAQSAAAFEQIKTEGLQALATAAGQVKTLLEGAFALIRLSTDPPALTSVAVGSATLTWFGNVTTWTRAVTTASAQAATGFETLQTAGLQALTAAAGFVKTLLEHAFKLVALSSNPPALTSVAVGSTTLTWFGNVTTWTRTVTTAAVQAATGFEELLTEGLQALVAASGQVRTLIETAAKLVELSTRPPALTSVAVGSVVLTWFGNVTTWTRAVTTAAAQAATGFEDIKTAGLQALADTVGPVKTLIDGVLSLVSLTMRPPTLPDVSRGSDLLRFFREAARWAGDVATTAAGAATGFEDIKTAGLQALVSAAGQVKTLIDAVLTIVEQVAYPPTLPVIAAGSALHSFLVSLLGFARSVAQVAAETAAGFETVVMDGLRELAKAVGDALKVLKDTLDLLIVANTEFNIPDNFAATIRRLTLIGIQMAAAYLEVASTFTGVVTPAATEAAKAMDMAAKFIKDVYDLAKKIVTEPPAIPSNFQDLIRRLVEMGKQIAVVFIDEANTFATNVGPGAEALLDVYAKMSKFFDGFNKAIMKIADIESIPQDAAAKVRRVMQAAVAMATEYITAANGFEGVKGQGATNLETIIAGFQGLVKSVKDLLKTMEDWGSAGVQSSEIAPALEIFTSILESLEGMVASSGVTAGTGYIVRFAENVRSNVTVARDALIEVVAGLVEIAGNAGRSAGLTFMQQMAAGIQAGAEGVKSALRGVMGDVGSGMSSAAASAGKAAGGGSGGAGAGGGKTVVHQDNRQYHNFITVNNANAQAARATNEGLLSLVLYNPG